VDAVVALAVRLDEMDLVRSAHFSDPRISS
jgi:hypothetical protein